MTNQNPLNIAFAAIIANAEKRRTNLEAIGQIVAHNAQSLKTTLCDAKTVFELLDARWEALDPEGKALLPETVRKVVGSSSQYVSFLSSVIGTETALNRNAGVRDLVQYAVPSKAVPTTGTDTEEGLVFGEYTIEVSFASTSDTQTIRDALQEVYDLNGPAGMFDVKTNGTWCWITFRRDIDTDRDYILQHIAKDFSLNPAKAAVIQLRNELGEHVDPDHDLLVDTIAGALHNATVKFP